jgi:MoxR-like ATPase
MSNTIQSIERNLNAAQAEKRFSRQEQAQVTSQKELDEIFSALLELGIEDVQLSSPAPREISELNEEESKIASARFRNMSASWKTFKKTEKLKEKLTIQLFRLQLQSKEENNPTAYAVQIDTINRAIDAIDTKINGELSTNPELYYAYHLNQLKDYKKQAEEGIVYTPYVNAQKAEIIEALKANQNIFIHGPFGSGKTDIAIAAAREYAQMLRDEEDKKTTKNVSKINVSNKIEPELETISEYSKIAKIDTSKPAEVVGADGDRFHIDLNGNKIEPIVLSGYRDIESHEIFGQPKLKVNEKGDTYSEFDFGPVYQAIELGLPLIIDEINSIPHTTLIALNFILEQGKRPGAIVNVKEDNGRQIVSKAGFCVIATGNLPDETGNNNIIGRQEMDAAGLSRFGKKIAHGFLPQSQEANREDGVLDRTGNELFEILMSKVVDSKVYAKLHPQAIEDLWKFTAFSSLIQDVYSGKNNDFKINYRQQDIAAVELIKGFSISWREINTVMNTWLASGCTVSLGSVIHGFVSEIPNNAAKEALGSVLDGKYDLIVDKASYNTDELVEYGPRDIIDLIYGDGPERTQESLAPYLKERVKVESSGAEIDPKILETVARLEMIVKNYEARLQEFEGNFEILCGAKIDEYTNV